jgi:cold shock CspA family protein
MSYSKYMPSSIKVSSTENQSSQPYESHYRKKREIKRIEGKQNLSGEVKWFNRRSGFGFIIDLSQPSSPKPTESSSNSGEEKPNDVFVHYSAIVETSPPSEVQDKREEEEKEIIKYLSVGEKVMFDLIEAQNPKSQYEFQAWNVRKADGTPFDFENEQRQFHRPSSSSSHYSSSHRNTSSEQGYYAPSFPSYLSQQPQLTYAQPINYQSRWQYPGFVTHTPFVMVAGEQQEQFSKPNYYRNNSNPRHLNKPWERKSEKRFERNDKREEKK